jgi:hypothetical protein
MAWIDVLKRPTEPERLRSAVLAALWSKLWRRDGPFSAEVRKSLLEIWNDPKSHLSFSLRSQLDGVLRMMEPTFEGSDDRRDVWLSNLLTFTPELRKHDNRANNIAHSVLRELAGKHPKATAQQIANQLLSPGWPALYRRGMACALLTVYQNAEQVEPKWKWTLDAYFTDLMQDGEPFPIRVAAGDLERSSDSDVRRSYTPDAELMAALKAGVERLQSASKRPGADPEVALAASELARVIKLLEARSNP